MVHDQFFDTKVLRTDDEGELVLAGLLVIFFRMSTFTVFEGFFFITLYLVALGWVVLRVGALFLAGC